MNNRRKSGIQGKPYQNILPRVMEEQTLIVSKDGSHTLYSSQYNQHYHNPNGAIEESLHVYFTINGLKEALEENRDFDLLEIGFGTGLNLMLLADLHESISSSSRVRYYTIEANLISPHTVHKLNYGSYLNNRGLMKKIPHFFGSSSGMNHFQVTDKIELHLFNGTFKQFSDASLEADFILHDPFSPGVNPELWTPDTFSKLKAHASDQAVLSTYSSATAARKAMEKAGWFTEKVPGILGKREMTVARVTP